MAVGQMNIPPDSFYAMTPVEFIYAWIGWLEHQESAIRQAWERERWAVWILTSIQMDKKDRMSAVHMFPLPWETPQDDRRDITMDERREIVRNMLKSTKNENNDIGDDPAYADIVQPVEEGPKDRKG